MQELVATRNEQARHGASQRASSAEPDICFGELPAEIGLPDATLPSLVHSSTAIFEGRIEEVTTGFYRGTPASLLALKVDAMPRASSLYAATIGGRMYVHYPSAVIRAEGTTLCTRPATHEARPKPGDRLLVFALQAPEDSWHVCVYPQARLRGRRAAHRNNGNLHLLRGTYMRRNGNGVDILPLDDIYFHAP